MSSLYTLVKVDRVSGSRIFILEAVSGNAITENWELWVNDRYSIEIHKYFPLPSASPWETEEVKTKMTGIDLDEKPQNVIDITDRLVWGTGHYG